jgi:hypothetical protein
MKFKVGPLTAVLWLFFLWLSVAFWSARFLGIRQQTIWLFYLGAHVITMLYVASKLEKKLTRIDPNTGLPVKVKLTFGRIAVIVMLGFLWALAYLAMYIYFPERLIGGFPGPFTTLVVPLLIILTVVESIWIGTNPPSPTNQSSESEL